MNNELTDWFPADTVPFHVGEYSVYDFWSDKYRKYWNGNEWSITYFVDDFKSVKNEARKLVAVNQNVVWLGLKHNPNVSK